MKIKMVIVLLVLGALMPISVNADARGPGRMPGGISMMSGGGNGMMGGMSGLGALILNIWKELSGKVDRPDQQAEREVEILRQQKRDKTRELASLFKAPDPDKDLIDQKIDELRRLESELDKKMNNFGLKGSGIINSRQSEGIYD